MTVKPCPFCGAEAVEDRLTLIDTSTVIRWFIEHKNDCWFEGGILLFPDGAEKWNTRAADDQTDCAVTLPVDGTYKFENGKLYTWQEPKRTADVQAQYNELLYAVARVFPDETRHQTALRYIQAAERDCLEGQQAKQEDEPKSGVEK